MRGRHRNHPQIVDPQEEMPPLADLSARAMKTMTAKFVPPTRKPLLIRVEGACPNCTHPTKWDAPLTVWGTDTGYAYFKRPSGQFLRDEGLGKIVMTPTATEFSMKCKCGKKGRDHEEGSCNAVWNMRVARSQ
jgi:hypothetical protein